MRRVGISGEDAFQMVGISTDGHEMPEIGRGPERVEIHIGVQAVDRDQDDVPGGLGIRQQTNGDE